MIQSIERIGTAKNHEGWFLVNGHLQVRYVQNEKGELISEINFDDKILTDQEAHELADQVLQEAIDLYRRNIG